MERRLLSGAAVSLWLAMVFQQPAALVFSLSIIGWLVVNRMNRSGAAELVVTRKLNHFEVTAGEWVCVEVQLTNAGKRTLRGVYRDNLPEALQRVEGDYFQLVQLKKNQSLTLRYKVEAVRGEHIWPNSQFERMSFLSQTQGVEHRSVHTELTVFPSFPIAGQVVLKPRSLFGATGSIISKQSGQGQDILGSRAFQFGDSLRSINWRMTGKYDTLMAKQTLQERNTTINLVVDARSASNSFAQGFEPFERSLSACAAIADQCLRAGHRVSLTLVGERFQQKLPGVGRKQFKSLLRVLASAKVGHEAGLEGFHRRYFKQFPQGTAFIWFSPLQMKDASELAVIRASGYQLVSVSCDLTDTIENEVSRRSYQLERQCLLRGFRSNGAIVIDWQKEQPFASALQSLHQQRWVS